MFFDELSQKYLAAAEQEQQNLIVYFDIALSFLLPRVMGLLNFDYNNKGVRPSVHYCCPIAL